MLNSVFEDPKGSELNQLLPEGVSDVESSGFVWEDLPFLKKEQIHQLFPYKDNGLVSK